MITATKNARVNVFCGRKEGRREREREVWLTEVIKIDIEGIRITYNDGFKIAWKKRDYVWNFI